MALLIHISEGFWILQNNVTEDDLKSQHVKFICKNIYGRPSAMHKTYTMFEQNEYSASQRTTTKDGIRIKHSKVINSILVKKKLSFD
jgi:hypothetical protein